MPTTSNFGWTTPADTDLVKDGAAAIRTLGNGVDASFVDLKGGTSGQILSKNSNTDLDFVWIANDQGDITAVTAGTGISGGGTSGAVTITNSMATEITASGDIIVGTGSGTFDNLPIGTTGQILTADTTVSPYKVKWATPAGGGKVLQVVQVETSTSTSVTSATFTDSGLSGSITPSSASSKILVMTMQPIAISRASNPVSARFRLLRGATTIWDGNGTGGGGFRVFAQAVTNDGLDLNALQNINYLDSPNTTSSVTYKTQMRVQTASDAETVTAQAASRPSTIILMEIGA